jgi:lipoprotein signal peptidase
VKKRKNFSFLFLELLTLFFGIVHNVLANTGQVVKNYGISFGINGSFFILLSILFVLILSFVFNKTKSFGLGLMLTGGLINLIDRIVLGYVRDYWYLTGQVYNNLADWLIGIGILFCLVECIWME